MKNVVKIRQEKPCVYAIENNRLIQRHGMTYAKFKANGLGFRKVLREEWRENIDLHRDDGPAFIERDLKTEIITYEVWYQHGLRHRSGDLPADIERDPFSGAVIAQEWCENNWGHRVGAPSYLKISPATGIVVSEGWSQNGIFHRDDGPAEIYRHPSTGIEVYERWWLNGKPHREDGPAEIERHPVTGEIFSQQYWQRGMSPDGPMSHECSRPDDVAVGIVKALNKCLARRALTL